MAQRLVEFPLQDGGSVLVQVDDPPPATGSVTVTGASSAPSVARKAAGPEGNAGSGGDLAGPTSPPRRSDSVAGMT